MDDESRLPALSAGRPPLKAESRPLASVPDDVLLRCLAEILGQSRHVETDLIAHIAEADERRLYAREAFPSMFAYCTEALHLSEGEAYLRIAVARASREHPMLLPMLGDGRLHLSAIALLAPHITAENRETLLRRAAYRSKRKIEELIAEVAPRKDAPSLMRRVPETPRHATLAAPTLTPSVAVSSASPVEPTPSGMGRTVTLSMAHPPALSPGASRFSGSPITGPRRSPPVLQPLALGRYKVQFTATAGLHEKLQRLRALMRSQVPDGDLGAIIEAAVTEKLERLEARRFATTSRPRKDLSTTDTSPSSRRIPAAVRRAVRERDGGRCRYVDTSGRRCDERQRLEYHHIHPFGLGGDHRPDNVRLMCAQHNAYLAEHDYGRGAMARFRRSRRAAILGASGTDARAHGIATVASAGTAGGPPRVAPRDPYQGLSRLLMQATDRRSRSLAAQHPRARERRGCVRVAAARVFLVALSGCGDDESEIKTVQWGGIGAELNVTSSGASALQCCNSTGVIQEPLVPDTAGNCNPTAGTFIERTEHREINPDRLWTEPVVYGSAAGCRKAWLQNRSVTSPR